MEEATYQISDFLAFVISIVTVVGGIIAIVNSNRRSEKRLVETKTDIDKSIEINRIEANALINKNKTEIDIKLLQLEKEINEHKCSTDDRFEKMLQRIDHNHDTLVTIINQLNQNILSHISSHNKL